MLRTVTQVTERGAPGSELKWAGGADARWCGGAARPRSAEEDKTDGRVKKQLPSILPWSLQLRVAQSVNTFSFIVLPKRQNNP